MALTGLLGLSKALLYARLLGNVSLGLYSIAVLIVPYAEYLCHAGLYRGLECILPALYGAGETTAAHALRNRTAAAILLITLAVLIPFTAIWLAFPELGGQAHTAVLWGAYITGADVLFGLAVQDLRARADIFFFGGLAFSRAAVNLAIGVPLTLTLGYQGALIADALSPLLLFVVAARFFCTNFRFVFGAPRELASVFHAGLPLMLRNLVSNLVLNLDRWIVALAFAPALFGQYAFAMIIVTAGALVHNVVTQHLGPRVIFDHGRGQDLRNALRRLDLFSLAMIAAFVLGWFPFRQAVAWFIPWQFPEYVLSAPLLTIVYWGVLFQILCQYDWVAMALRQTRLLFYATAGVSLAMGCLYAAGLSLGWGLNAFAWLYTTGRLLAALAPFVIARALVRSASAVTRDVRA